MIRYRGVYIKGRFQKGAGPLRVKLDPGNLDLIIGRWKETLNGVNPAVIAARNAFSGWAGLGLSPRIQFIKKFQKVLRKRKRELAQIISMEVGKTLRESLGEVEAAIAKVDYTIRDGLPLVHSTRKKSPGRYYEWRPRGVLAVLGPFNFPLHLPNGNFVAGLATGNTIVFKPSELTPFTGQTIASCFHEAGFPKGVFNLVQGGREVGDSLVRHEEVNGVLFIGSDQVGMKIQETIRGEPGKIGVMEMGGKNAAIIFGDADLNLALKDCLKSFLATTGQRCTSLSRIIVHEKVAGEFMDRLVEGAVAWNIGYYQDSKAQMGPLVSEAARRKFLKYQKMAEVRGIKTLVKGQKIQGPNRGYYVSPGIHWVKVKASKKEKVGYRYDEIFGPDVAIYTFSSLKEAALLHNDSRYGLVGSVFTRKKQTFQEVSKSLAAGNIFWNRPTIGAAANLPFGGIKASGNHFPAGLFSPYYCTYPVAIQE